MFHGLTLRGGGGEETESEWKREEEEKKRETYARSVNRQITWQNDQTNLQHHNYKGSLTVLYLTPVTFIFKENGGAAKIRS